MVIQQSGPFPQVPATASLPVGEEIHPKPEKSTLRVLVVDDEPLVLWSITEILHSRGFEVEEASSANAALRAFTAREGPPDVVLLDLNLPDSNDLGLLLRMRRLAPRTRIILMTAFGTPEVRAEARRMGVVSVIDKPFDLDSLDDLLMNAVQ